MAEHSTSDGETGEPFEAARPDYRAAQDDSLVLDLDGFEGPIDVLLTLARKHKVDITKISILALANQYLDFIARARGLRLEIAADYLVMASWLAYLKSRLLLPSSDDDDEPTGAELAARLAFQLQRLESMREAAGKLMRRAQLGHHQAVGNGDHNPDQPGQVGVGPPQGDQDQRYGDERANPDHVGHVDGRGVQGAEMAAEPRTSFACHNAGHPITRRASLPGAGR